MLHMEAHGVGDGLIHPEYGTRGRGHVAGAHENNIYGTRGRGHAAGAHEYGISRKGEPLESIDGSHERTCRH